MAIVSCPHCKQPVYRAGFPVWVWLVAIILFPVGLLAFAVGRKPSQCQACGYSFVA